MIPLWAVFGLLTAAASAAMMLLQERFKVEAFALAVWCKVACVIVALPFMLARGVPDDPLFYVFLTIQGLMFTVADVVLFRVIPIVGAGVISRLMPGTVVAGFVLCFAIWPADIAPYLETPLLGAGIVLSLAMTAFFAARLNKCAISRDAVRRVWFLLFAMTAGIANTKIILSHASPEQGPFAFTCIEALMMIAFWLAWLKIAKPVPARSLLEKRTVLPSLAVGTAMAALLFVMLTGYYHVDNPGYIMALRLLDAVIILGIHRALGKHDGSDAMSGLGIAAGAALLIVLKAQVP